MHVHMHYRGKNTRIHYLHTCRGNVHGMHVAEAQGSVKEILWYREENSYTFQDNFMKFCICDNALYAHNMNAVKKCNFCPIGKYY